MDENIKKFEDALLSIDREQAHHILSQAIAGQSSNELIEQLIVPVLERIGRGWEKGEVALSQVYMSSRICEEFIDTALPSDTSEQKTKPLIAICLLEDYHMLGKRIVYSFLRLSGFNLLDLGRVSAAEAVSRVLENDIKILLISTLMLPSALKVKEIRESLGTEIKIAVGGAPFRFDEELYKEVGADAMGKTASHAIAITKKFMEELS
ncbi:MAG: cobalamin-binding protein [bacterium]|nr:cobalamin-binding protein [bacterium]